MPIAHRILFLGLDGGTEAVLDAAFARGWMPQTASLWRNAATGALRSSDPMITPVAWTSFSTGCLPQRHGIHEFYHVDPEDGSIRPNHAGRVKVPTLWHALSAAGREVAVLNLPMTYPPPRVQGLVVAGSDAPGLDWAFVQCPEFGRNVREALPDFTHKVIWKRRPRSVEELEDLSRRTCAIFRAQADAALMADRRVDWTSLLVHFHNLDGLLHRAWPDLDLDETSQTDARRHRAAVLCLRALDEAIGSLLELAARRGAAVIAASDHGFGPCKRLVNVNGLLRAAGFQKSPGWSHLAAHRAARLGDKVRRWMAKRRPDGSARRMPRTLEAQVRCDWRKTQAFAPFGQLSACVMLASRRRGWPHANRDERIAREIVQALRATRDPETGARLFADVYHVARRYRLDPIAEGLPDVMGLSADGYQAQGKWSMGDNVLLAPDPNLPATHYREGILAIDAPGVRPTGRLKARLHDVAPTTLAMLGLDIPEVMQGRVVHEAFLAPLPVRKGAVPSAPTIDTGHPDEAIPIEAV